MREFIFKYLGNCLGINVRISHFITNPDRKCSLCKIINANTDNEETFLHLFWECPVSKKLHSTFITTFFPEIGNDVSVTKLFVLTGLLENENISENLFVKSAVWCHLWLIWQCKLKKRIMAPSTYKFEFALLMNNIFCNSSSVRNDRLLANFKICREWFNLKRDDY